MEFISSELDEYVCAHTEQEPELLYELNRETNMKVLRPRMLSGHYQGRVLSMLSHMIRPNRILEIGTYTGYSALCLAEGLQPEGTLITIDKNEELETLVRKYVEASPYQNQIDLRVGDAMELVPQLDGEFDLIFIDADKENYLNYYHMVIDKVRVGGYILIDNVLWSGKVIEPLEEGDRDTEVLLELNDYVHFDERVQNVLLPIRDGLTILRKK